MKQKNVFAILIIFMVSCSTTYDSKYERQVIDLTQTEMIMYKNYQHNLQLIDLMDSLSTDYDLVELKELTQGVLKSVEDVKEELITRSGGRSVATGSYINPNKGDVVAHYFNQFENINSLMLNLNKMSTFLNLKNVEIEQIASDPSTTIPFMYDPNFKGLSFKELYFRNATLMDALLTLTLLQMDVINTQDFYIDMSLIKSKSM